MVKYTLTSGNFCERDICQPKPDYIQPVDSRIEIEFLWIREKNPNGNQMPLTEFEDFFLHPENQAILIF